MPSTASNNKHQHKWQFDAIGTRWRIETEKPLDSLKHDIAGMIEQFDKTYSRFRDDSLVAEVSRKAGKYKFPDDARKLVEQYKYLYNLTDGAVSPLVGQILHDAGYDQSYTLQPHVVKKAPAWDDVMSWQGATLHAARPLLLDFGAAGKGYLVDLIGEILDHHGHQEYVIDASGDIRTRGPAQVVGLENPHDPTMVIGTVELQNASLCASAVNRRAWGSWHHIVDPRSAQPVRNIVATWVIAPTTLLADGLATALFFVSGSNITDASVTYVRLYANGTVEQSPALVGQLFV